MSGDHSFFAPSGAGAMVHCPAHPTMSQLYPQPEDTEEAIEGEKRHEEAAELIAKAARGEIVESDDEAVNTYVEYVIEIMRKTGVFTPHIEERVDISVINTFMWGTCDLWLFDKSTGNLWVIDFKYGHGVVDAYENWQLMCYTAGILEQLKVDGIADQHITVNMVIVQPRAYHWQGPIREWSVRASDLRGYFNRLSVACENALHENPETHTGSHCRYCPARINCEAALRAGNDLYELVSKMRTVELTSEQIGSQLSLATRAIKHMESLKTALTAQIESLIKSGQTVPGYMTVNAEGRQNWDKTYEEVVMLGEMYGVDVSKKDLITPKQAIKLGIDESVINAYSSKKSTGVKVVEDKTNKAREVFSK